MAPTWHVVPTNTRIETMTTQEARKQIAPANGTVADDELALGSVNHAGEGFLLIGAPTELLDWLIRAQYALERAMERHQEQG